jgi:hypothetical protein
VVSSLREWLYLDMWVISPTPLFQHMWMISPTLAHLTVGDFPYTGVGDFPYTL